MVTGQPEIHSRFEKTDDMRFGKIKEHGSPFTVPQGRVSTFIKISPVKFAECVIVTNKMCGNEIHDNTDFFAVAAVNKVHKLLWGTIAAGGRKVAGDLISP